MGLLLVSAVFYLVYRARAATLSTSASKVPPRRRSLSATVHHGFYHAFFAWGAFVARKPKKVIGISLAVSLVCMARLLPAFGPLATELEVENLWVPQGAAAYNDKLKYDAAFSTLYRRNYI